MMPPLPMSSPFVILCACPNDTINSCTKLFCTTKFLCFLLTPFENAKNEEKSEQTVEQAGRCIFCIYLIRKAPDSQDPIEPSCFAFP